MEICMGCRGEHVLLFFAHLEQFLDLLSPPCNWFSFARIERRSKILEYVSDVLHWRFSHGGFRRYRWWRSRKRQREYRVTERRTNYLGVVYLPGEGRESRTMVVDVAHDP